jgi:hypothetical protein
MTDQAWLVRIAGDHLEVGNNEGAGILRWPKGDTSDTQIWALKMSMESENTEPWNFEVGLRWRRKSNTLEAVAGKL